MKTDRLMLFLAGFALATGLWVGLGAYNELHQGPLQRAGAWADQQAREWGR